MVKKKYKIIDLFAGCGGLSDGFEQTGKYRFLSFVEWEKKPCETLKERLKNKWGYRDPEKTVLRFDMQRTDELIHGWTGDPLYGSNPGLKNVTDNQTIDIIIGGPPCQAYSIAGRVRDKYGMRYDYRNYLFESYLRIVDLFKPKTFIFENVPGILSACPGNIPITDRISDSFSKIGYDIIRPLDRKIIIDASEYNVPQIRKRVIILGVDRTRIKTEPQNALKDFYSNILTQFKSNIPVTTGDAINDLDPIYNTNETMEIGLFDQPLKENKSRFLDHTPRFHNSRDRKIFRELALDKRRKTGKYSSVESLKKLYFEKTGKQSNFHKYHVLDIDKPSNTIPAHLYKDGLRHIHPDPEQARSLTPREAARLQGFDDDFKFIGNMGDKYKMIGNAVPPPLARNIAEALDVFIQKYFI